MDYIGLFGKLEKNLERIEDSDDVLATLSAILELLVEDFRGVLGIVGGRIYALEDDAYVLQSEYPASDPHRGFRLPLSYPPVQEVLARGFTLHGKLDPGVDRAIEGALDVETFAAIRVGTAGPRILAFSLEPGSDRDQVLYTLNTIRQVIQLKLRKEQLEDHVAQAREIQHSLLPATMPRFADYDIWGHTQSAEEVGGDLYDFLPVSDRSLGIAIADAAGHGLPAALQARDAIIGLRMGIEERMRITATVEKLNKVVSQSALASRFISLVYAEVETNGNLVYCNAGHVPPLLYRDGEFEELRQGGLILGPNPDAQYARGYTTIQPGSVLVLYTDGIVEAETAGGEMFGKERLQRLVVSGRDLGAEELGRGIFDEVTRFAGRGTGVPPVDDQTVVVVRRRSTAAAAET